MTQPTQGDDPTQYGGQQPAGPGGYGQQPPSGGQPGGPGGYDQGPPKKQTGLIIAVGAIVLLLVAGAVGGFLLLSGDDAATDNTATEETTSATEETTSATEETTSATEETTSATEETTSAPPSSVVPTVGGDYCDKVRAYDSDASLATTDFTTPAGQQKLVDILVDLETAAPPELKDDYQVVLDGFEAIREGRPQDLVQTDFTNAFAAISADAEKNCGVDMGG
jgi:cytoskeletal protein RodZ